MGEPPLAEERASSSSFAAAPFGLGRRAARAVSGAASVSMGFSAVLLLLLRGLLLPLLFLEPVALRSPSRRATAASKLKT
eukprot:CAMPEP_0118888002 /NCGR_PEP_ID=MMETSP1163-20130328/25499_1 /TAXON_ID=124430 /ORGANISM="Phaeomonas parva, Strain CCMP2877" /LENGTH=79 /DNA_ID=CAMNT_0006826561 /DNA_START=1483 /DNA_END=1718 /DNA_ORIENTATION=-